MLRHTENLVFSCSEPHYATQQQLPNQTASSFPVDYFVYLDKDIDSPLKVSKAPKLTLHHSQSSL